MTERTLFPLAFDSGHSHVLARTCLYTTHFVQEQRYYVKWCGRQLNSRRFHWRFLLSHFLSPTATENGLVMSWEGTHFENRHWEQNGGEEGKRTRTDTAGLRDDDGWIQMDTVLKQEAWPQEGWHHRTFDPALEQWTCRRRRACPLATGHENNCHTLSRFWELYPASLFY